MKRYSGFSMLLKLYRKSNYYTQAEAGKHLGYSQETIKAWEGNKRFPLREDIPRLALLMGLNPQELEQAVDTSRLNTTIHKIRGETGLLHEAVEAANSTSFLPSALMQIISVQKDLLSRRQSLVLLTGFPAAIFRLTETGPSSPLHPGETLTLCAAYIPLCWQLYFEGGLTEVRQILPSYLAQLSLLGQEPSFYQKQAAGLASKAYQLATCLEMHQHHKDAALENAHFALRYGEIAEDSDLQVASLIQQANVYFSFKQPKQELQAYQQAVQLSENVSSLLQGRAYIGLAKAYASIEQAQEATHFLEMAHEALELYRHMRKKWRNERAVKALKQYFRE